MFEISITASNNKSKLLQSNCFIYGNNPQMKL